MSVVRPRIGRIVLYRTDGRNGLVYDLPAIVTVTVDTHPGDYPDGRRNPLPVPSGDGFVHLTVFTPGGFGTAIAVGAARFTPSSEDFPDAPALAPGSGTYVEWDVPHADPPVPRSWRWPQRLMETYLGERPPSRRSGMVLP